MANKRPYSLLNLEAIDEIYGTNAYCPIPEERRRRSKCMCLSRLLKGQEERTKRCLSEYLFHLNKVVGKKEVAARYHVLFGTKRIVNEYDRINTDVRSGYVLPDVASADKRAISICRNSMVVITKVCLGIRWSECRLIYPTEQVVANQKRKETVFAIIAYLLSSESTGVNNKINWKTPRFRATNIPLKTAQNYVTRYDLRRIVANCLISSTSEKILLKENFGCTVINIGQYRQGVRLHAIAEQGFLVRDEKWEKVNSRSFANDPRYKQKKVRYVEIARCRSRAHGEIDKVNQIISDVLSEDVWFRNLFLQSDGQAPQNAHVDFPVEMLQKWKGKIHVCILPLTTNGSYIQLWRRERIGEPGFVVQIQYGTMLLIPAETLHGGGFQSSAFTKDLRLEIFAFSKEIGMGVVSQNQYQCVSVYPMSRHLDEYVDRDSKTDRELNLADLFTMDE